MAETEPTDVQVVYNLFHQWVTEQPHPDRFDLCFAGDGRVEIRQWSPETDTTPDRVDTLFEYDTIHDACVGLATAIQRTRV